jgi:hypothetical protein
MMISGIMEIDCERSQSKSYVKMFFNGSLGGLFFFKFLYNKMSYWNKSIFLNGKNGSSGRAFA